MRRTHRANGQRAWRVAAAGTAGAALIGVVALQTASAGQQDAGDERGTSDTTEQTGSPEPAPEAAPGTGAAPGEVERQATEDYWTDERIAAATPTETPAVDSAEVAAAESPSATLPREVEAGTVPDGAAEATETDRPLALSVAERWHGQGALPARTTGKIYYTRADGRDSWCSASVVTGENEGTVWTAGHCVHDGVSGTNGYHTNIVFVPDHDNGEEPHGRWAYTYVNTTVGWQNNGDFNYDYAAIAIAPNDDGDTLQSVVGSQGFDFGGIREFDDITAMGYPAAGYQRDDFTGDHLWYCQGSTTEHRNDVRLACDMHSGASGSPWLRDLDSGDGTGYLVTAYSYRLVDENGDMLNEFGYAPTHGDGAINLHRDVSTR